VERSKTELTESEVLWVMGLAMITLLRR
jgi:hypothetical protein